MGVVAQSPLDQFMLSPKLPKGMKVCHLPIGCTDYWIGVELLEEARVIHPGHGFPHRFEAINNQVHAFLMLRETCWIGLVPPLKLLVK
jgi:hypothetical protein